MTNLCVVLGNGPSLKGFGFTRLTGVATLGMNAAYRYWDQINWYPNYYACLDDQMIESHHNQIYRLWTEGLIEQFFVHSSFFTHHPDCICAPGFHSLDQVLPHWYNKRGRDQGWPDLSQDPAFKTSDTTKITTGAFAARFAAYLGHDKLALMGIDLKYVEIIKEAERTDGVGLVMRETPKENPNYFFDSYQKAGDKYNIPNPDVHDNKLHIQSFQLIPTDFLAFGQDTQIVNTNPKSMLEIETVFPLEPIETVLKPHKMAAIVVPTNRFEIKAILANFDIWANAKYAPLLPGNYDTRTALVFMFNNNSAKQHEAEIRTHFDTTNMARFFSGVSFEYLELEDDLDKYERDYTKKIGDHGYKSGPNNQFFRTMYKAENLGHYIFQMETDCVPLRAGWLTALRNSAADEPDFWVLGSAYHGLEDLSPAFKNHINGNAMYAVGDTGFQDFLKTFWEPRTHNMVKGQDKRLAYDCILEKVFTEGKNSDPVVAEVIEKHGTMFRFSEYILNISGKKDLENLSATYESELLAQYNTAYILHNRSAQAHVALKTSKQMMQDIVKPAQLKMSPETLPRLLIIDMTAMGNGTATGEVKSNLLREWPANRLLQIASPKPEELSIVRAGLDGTFTETPCDSSAVFKAITNFSPELILYRPLPERPKLHALAISTIKELDLPLVTWIMDDWPTRLYAEDNLAFHRFDPDLKDLLKRSVLRLSICDAMSEALSKRYGLPFQAFANGVDLINMPKPKTDSSKALVLRYSGGLAIDMNAASIQRVAEAVQILADQGQDIRFEINTQAWWIKESGKLFKGFSATHLTSKKRDFKAYSKWLTKADILLIAYNFNEASLRYVRYSMANKLPEYLGSGVPILAHGPQGIATIDYISKQKTAQVVSDREVEAIVKALTQLSDPSLRKELAQTGLELAKNRHDLPVLAKELAQTFYDLCPIECPAEFSAYLTQKDGGFLKEDFNQLKGKSSFSEPSGVLVHPDPVAVISFALEQGQDGKWALLDWQSQAKAQMSLYNKTGDFFQIVEHSQAAPKMEVGTIPKIVTDPLKKNNPLFYVLANLIFDQSPSAKSLLTKLRKAGAAPKEAYANIDIDAAVNYSQSQIRMGKTGRGMRISSSASLLQEQVIQLQATAETYYADAERMRSNHSGNAIGHGYLQTQAARLQLELDQIYRSKSWRVTAPLRSLYRFLKSNKG